MTFRALAVMVAIVALAATDARLALAATLLYALAYTLELAVALALYFSGEPRVRRLSALALGSGSRCRSGSRSRRSRGRRRGGVRPLARVGARRVDPDPHRPARPLDQQGRRLSDPRDDLHDRPRALPDARPDRLEERGRAAPGGRGDGLRHRADPDRRAGAPHKAIARWFPYVASLFLFIWTVNMLGFIPLPLSDETFELFGVELPTLAVFAATLDSVGHDRARAADVRLHARRGHPLQRAVKYFKSWIPDVPKGLYPLIVPARDPRPVHAPDQPQRPSLREHARRPHADPHVHRPDLPDLDPRVFRVSRSSAAAAFYLFEVVIVVSIQAFIFAALSAIYIGSAIEPEH